MSLYVQQHASIEALIEDLRKEFQMDLLQFQMNVSMFLAGNHNKRRRQELIQRLTGEKRPVTKCGLTAVTFELNKEFTQTKLF